MSFFKHRRGKIREIAPDEIFLDSSNLPSHDEGQFEGRVERPVSPRTIWAIGLVFLVLAVVFSVRSYDLQILHGKDYANISRNNRLDRSIIFATRGIIYDRTGREIAWNESPPSARTDVAIDFATSSVFALRKYSSLPGLSHVVGFVRYPKADSKGTWWREEYVGISGAELAFDSILRGKNGSTMREIDARERVVRENLVSPAHNGSDIRLSIDAQMESELYKILSAHASAKGFAGGASVIMNVHTGEVLALTSFPEYDHAAFTAGNTSVVRAAVNDPRTPMLNRAVAGAYTPGSIVKPIFAAAALKEGVISPDKQILSTGAIKIPNPYDPSRPSIFKDWTVHGWVDMRTAIAVSSDEYFYTIGGGYGGQQGLGINRLDEYARIFGLGTSTGIALLGEVSGIIPTPEWKELVFGSNDPWRIGDTYNTAIGQYGFQVTALQAVRFISAIANGGKLLTPQLLAISGDESDGTGTSTDSAFSPQKDVSYVNIDIPDEYLQVVREGMRLAVISNRTDATVKSLNIGGIDIAAKTGTAQTGVNNESMNSWSIGFWPEDNPRYAYATVLEKAPAETLSGASPAMLPFFQWLIANKPEYVQ
jgi:penicillin-binding protein 2